MAIITKKVGKRFYAYVSERQGGKVVHKYIGPADAPEVREKIAAGRKAYSVPKRFRSLFWDARLEDIHTGRNARYIIERVLEMGGLETVNWLERIYPNKKIAEVLLMSRGLSPKSRNFWSLWFGLENS